MTLIDDIRNLIIEGLRNDSFCYDDILTYLDEREEEYRVKNEERKNQRKDLIPFGKYKDKKITDIVKIDSRYMKWMLKNCSLNDELKTRIENELNITKC